MSHDTAASEEGQASGARFERTLDVLADLVRAEAVRFKLEEPVGASTAHVAMRVLDPTHPSLPELLKLLELKPALDHYALVDGGAHQKGQAPWSTIEIQTRSLLGMLSFVAHHVDVPAEDLAAGLVAPSLVARAEAKTGASSQPAPRARIHSGSELPKQARIGVRHRGRWFYVEDSDVGSKSLLVILSQLYALQAAPPQLGSPTLTLPVGR